MRRKRRIRRIALFLIAGIALTWLVVRAVFMPPQPLTDALSPALTRFGPYDPRMDLRASFESLPPLGGVRAGLALLPSNPEAWIARWRMLSSARRSIDVSYFILRDDVFGAAFLGHLLQKARQGVSVRLLLDSQGTMMSFVSPRGNDWLDTLANTRRIQVKLFRPLASRYLEALATINPVAAMASEHDKILVCDRRLGMIGGRNISAEYFAHVRDMPAAFEDADILLHGARIARALIAAFEAQYHSAGARKVEREMVNLASYTEELTLAYRAMDAWLKGVALDRDSVDRIKALRLSWSDDLAEFPRLYGAWQRNAHADTQMEAEAEVRLLDSTTRLAPRADVIAQALMRLIQGARDHILIQSPYLVLSKEAIDVLAGAGKRGVRIAIYTNSPISSDNALSQAFFMDQWPEILAQVPGLRLFVTGGSRTLHGKLITFDDQVALVGTYNLDPVSMAVNSEIMVAIWSQPFARRVAAQTRTQLAHGAPEIYEYKIKRGARAEPIRDRDGKPIVTFGPQHHLTAEQWGKVRTYWAVLRTTEKFTGITPLF